MLKEKQNKSEKFAGQRQEVLAIVCEASGPINSEGIFSAHWKSAPKDFLPMQRILAMAKSLMDEGLIEISELNVTMPSLNPFTQFVATERGKANFNSIGQDTKKDSMAYN